MFKRCFVWTQWVGDSGLSSALAFLIPSKTSNEWLCNIQNWPFVLRNLALKYTWQSNIWRFRDIMEAQLTAVPGSYEEIDFISVEFILGSSTVIVKLCRIEFMLVPVRHQDTYLWKTPNRSESLCCQNWQLLRGLIMPNLEIWPLTLVVKK